MHCRPIVILRSKNFTYFYNLFHRVSLQGTNINGAGVASNLQVCTSAMLSLRSVGN
jgi:hypothetical protein